jgi:hypothetical protein
MMDAFFGLGTKKVLSIQITQQIKENITKEFGFKNKQIKN